MKRPKWREGDLLIRQPRRVRQNPLFDYLYGQDKLVRFYCFAVTKDFDHFYTNKDCREIYLYRDYVKVNGPITKLLYI